jgi:hypothetical protein
MLAESPEMSGMKASYLIIYFPYMEAPTLVEELQNAIE